MKLVVNRCYGGFGLSEKAHEWLGQHGWASNRESRADPLLVQCVEELGKEASSKLSELEVVEIPDGVDWEIDEYDGIETVHERHRSW